MADHTAAPLGVDRALRLGQSTITFYLLTGTAWLIVSSLFWWLNTAQAFAPNAWYSFAGVPWLTYGRVYPAFTNTFVFGWASLTGLGVALYFVSRLSRLSWRAGVLILTAGIIWNLSLVLGLWHVLGGGSTGRELLEINPSISFGFFLAAVLITTWLLVEFWVYRNELRLIPLWYLLAALLCFIWVFTTGQTIVNYWHTGGATQPAIQSWYVNGLYQLWLVPLALGAAYILIPEGVQRPVNSLHLARIGFWGYGALAVWVGLFPFLGGPFPAWMQTVTIVANVLLILPVLALFANFHRTLNGRYDLAGPNLPLRFAMTGFFLFVAATFWSAFVSFRTVDFTFHFTLGMGARWSLLLAGFVSFTLMGAVYYAVPRLLDRSWLVPGMMKLQFWLAAAGVGLLAFDQIVGGLIQGFGLADAKIEFSAVVDIIRPFLLVQFIAVGMLFFSYLLFGLSLLLILCFRYSERTRAAAEPVAPVETPAEVSVA
jgi:cytochrome c oxidase cbb3-type subunit 1